MFAKMKEKMQVQAAGLKKKALMAVGVTAAVAALPVSAFASTPPSTATDFSGTDGLDIAVTDVISTGFSFMNQFNVYTTLVLGIIFAPVAIGFIIWIWNKLPKLGAKKAG